MSDQNIEINLDELLKNVTIPTGNKEQQNDSLDLPNVSVNPNNNISLDIPPLDFPKTNDISSLDDILMLSKHKEGIGKKERDASEVDLTLKEFPEVKKFFEDSPHHLFDTTNFYKKVLHDDNDDKTKRLHITLTKYLTCKDPKDKTIFRQEVIQAYWNFVANIPTRIATGIASKEECYACRYGLLYLRSLQMSKKLCLQKLLMITRIKRLFII